MWQIPGILGVNVVEVGGRFEKDVAHSEDQWLLPLSDCKVFDQATCGFANDKGIAENLSNKFFPTLDR
jgi:hypothetical protein